MQEYQPSKFELLFELLGRVANGAADAFQVPSYLTWGLIILLICWLLYLGFVFIEGIMRYIRYALLLLSVVWLVGFLFAVQYYASHGGI